MAGNMMKPLDDAALRKALSRIARLPDGSLPWAVLSKLDGRWKARLEELHIKFTNDDEVEEDKRCWIWQGAVSDGGKRPSLTVGTKQPEAYRPLYATYRGLPLPPGTAAHIHHICGNPMCVRPGGRHCGPISPEDHRTVEAWLRLAEKDPEAAVMNEPRNFISIDIERDQES